VTNEMFLSTCCEAGHRPASTSININHVFHCSIILFVSITEKKGRRIGSLTRFTISVFDRKREDYVWRAGVVRRCRECCCTI